MKMWLGLGCPCVLLAVACCLHSEAQAPAQPPQHFDKKIAPLLANRCLDCHAGARPRGGLDLTSRKTALEGGDSGAVLVPGDAARSLLWKHVNTGKMPPKKPLSAGE